MTKTAIILGATGLTGGYLLDMLLKDASYSKVKLFSRSSVSVNHPKLKEYLGDLLKLTDQKLSFTGHVVFCCIGTTKAKTKDQAMYRAIDYGIPLAAAELSLENGIDCFLVISAMGASETSNVFYNKTKGEMERDVLEKNIPNTYILRPSLIGGDRKESRPGERIAQILMRFFGFLVPKKYKIIHPKTIARAMLILANTHPDMTVIESNQIKEITTDG